MCFMLVFICALFKVLGFVLMSVLLNVVRFLGMGVAICVLSVLCVVGGVLLWVVCVFRRVVVVCWVSVVHPVAIMNVVYCVICSLLMFEPHTRGNII